MKKVLINFSILCLCLFVINSGYAQNNVITLNINKPLKPIAFVYDSNKGYWVETYNDKDFTWIEFETFKFSHLIGGEGTSFGGYYWEGFTSSINGDNADYGSSGNSEGWVDNQWGNMAGGGILTDNNGNVVRDENGKVKVDTAAPYFVANWSFYSSETKSLQTLFSNGKRYKAVGVYINNHPWPYYGNIHGDGFARPLNQEGDYFKLIFHGLDKNNESNGKTVEHILAEYKNGELHQSPDWEWVDLSSLGEVSGLYYTMETTDADPIYGPNTAVYFCMDKLQVQRPSNVTVTMNATSQKIILVDKETNDTLNVGAMSSSGYKYAFAAYPGTYTLSAYQSDGTTSNGTIDLTISNDTVQSFQFNTITTGATNAGWIMGTDYTVSQKVTGRDGTVRTTTLGSSKTANRATFLVNSGDSYSVQLIPNDTHASEGYLPYEVIATTTINASVTGAIPMSYNYEISTPSDAKLFVGKKYAHFQRFAEIDAIAIDSTTTTGKKVYSFKLANNQVYNYRVSQATKLTYAGIFTMSSSLAPLEITTAMLDGNPKQIDKSLTNNNKFNVADIFLNINEKNYLKLTNGATYQLVNLRTWQTTNTITDNYFIEPDFHYAVVNENGQADKSVVTVDKNGLLSAVGNGTAIVLVTYDAINVKSAMGGPFFGAIWPENTGVVVVKVGETNDSGITPNMKINESLNTATNKVAGINVDAELDVFYYPSDKDGYDYTFTPTGVTGVSMAQSTVGDTLSYNGFSTNNVKANADGSYTLHLTYGKNIVKLVSAIGGIEYQVLRAKPVSYTITNTTKGGSDIYPGDKVSIAFNTLYHPCNKLAGVYNMSAKIVYSANGSTANSTSNQYTFASTVAAQTVSATIPDSWDASKTFDFTGGAINVNGYGDPYGGHRDITLESGKNPNFTAVIRNAYFGVLPTISVEVKSPTTTNIENPSIVNAIGVYPNPSSHYIILSISGDVNIYSSTGQLKAQTKKYEKGSALDISNLENGVYFIKIDNTNTKFIKK